MEPQKGSSSVPPEAMQTLQFWQRFLQQNPHALTGSAPPQPLSEEENKALEAELKNLFAGVFKDESVQEPSSGPTPAPAADTPFESVKQLRQVRPMFSNMLKLFTEVCNQPSAESQKSPQDETLALKQLIQRFTGCMLDDAFKTVAQEHAGQNQNVNAARMADISRVMKEGTSAFIDALLDKPIDERFWTVCTPQATLGDILEAGTERFVAPFNTMFNRYAQAFGPELGAHAQAAGLDARQLFQEGFKRFKSPQWSQANMQASAVPMLPAATGGAQTALVPMQTDDILKQAGLGELVPLIQNTQLASNYEFRFAEPKNSFERDLAHVFTVMMPEGASSNAGMLRQFEGTFGKIFGTIYHMANVQTPEEFEQKTLRIQKAQEVVRRNQDPAQTLAWEHQTMKALLLTEKGNIGMGARVDDCFERFKTNPQEKAKFDDLHARAIAFYAQEVVIETKKGIAECKLAIETATVEQLRTFSTQDIMSRSFARVQEKTKAKIEAWAKREQSESNKQYLLIIQRYLELLVDSGIRITFSEQEELRNALGRSRSLTHEGHESRSFLTQTDKIVQKLFNSGGRFVETIGLMRDLDSLTDDALVLHLQAKEEQKFSNDLAMLQSAAQVIEID